MAKVVCGVCDFNVVMDDEVALSEMYRSHKCLDKGVGRKVWVAILTILNFALSYIMVDAIMHYYRR